MRRFTMTIALVCVLSAQVLAGDIPTGGAPKPEGTTQATLLGDIPCGQQVSSAALTLIQTMVGLVT
jgi:hypothetical protein